MLTINSDKSTVTDVSIDALDMIPVPTMLPSWRKKDPAYTYWRPIQHGELAREVIDTLKEIGFIVLDTKWHLILNESGIIGIIKIKTNKKKDILFTSHNIFNNLHSSGMSCYIALRHSNDGRHALKFIAGTEVSVCSNGMMISNFKDQTTVKHSKNIDLKSYIYSSLERILYQFGEIYMLKRQLQGIGISTTEGNNLIIAAYINKIAPWNMLSGVVNEWNSPSHVEFCPRTGWSLYNAFTHAAKKRSPSDQALTISKASAIIIDYDHGRAFLNHFDRD